MLSSGASITPELLARAHELMPNTRIGEVYGFSEGGPVSFEVKQADTLRPQCVGWPILGADVRIVDDDGNDCAIGSPGEVAVRNIAPFEGFVNNESRARLMDGGYVLSGDIAIRDDDGRLRLVDRKADMIVTGGENVYSAEVEWVLANHLGVQEVAVVGSPDEKWGEIVTAVVVTTDDGAFDPQKFDETCRKELAPFKRPRRVVFRTAEEMPRSALGKVQKFVLREQLRAEFSILNPR
jgi:acyl-CoA synthetase (AMP-forming)/AMP-acid ligase II